MAVVLRSASVWADEEETEMMEIGENANSPEKSNLLIRTSWVDAWTGYNSVNKGKSTGNKRALWLRSGMQRYLFQLGNYIQVHSGIVVCLGLTALFMCCLGLKTTQIESNIEKLWVAVTDRLSREMRYTEDALGVEGGILNEIVIQVPQKEGTNVLTVDRLLFHLDVIRAATSATVEFYGVPWKFRDICLIVPLSMTSGVEFETTINEILEKLQPCMFVSPLDCFWEGSKLLGPDLPVFIPPHMGKYTWANLNPIGLLNSTRMYFANSKADVSPALFNAIYSFLNGAGISSAYQNKPCLNPFDPECPKTAPNYSSKKPPDIAAVLTKGCDGISDQFMHWKEDLILGGIQRNRTGHIVKAEALQTMVTLVDEKHLYESHKKHLNGLPWNETIAAEVIGAWEKKFVQEIDRHVTNGDGKYFQTTTTQRYRRTSTSKTKVKDKVYASTSRNLETILKDCSQVSFVKIVLGFFITMCYSCLVMVNVKKCQESQVGVTMAGLLLLVLSSAAGLGLSSLLNLTFNATTVQVVPFLVLGFGIDHIFLILHTYSQLSMESVPYGEQTGSCLKRVGAIVVISSVCNSLAFLLASVIPIPITRFFSLQCCLLTLVNMVSIMVVFPAIVSIDLMRRSRNKADLFCCFDRSVAPSVSVKYKKSPRNGRTSCSIVSSPSTSSSSSSSSRLSNQWTECDDDFSQFSPKRFQQSSSSKKSSSKSCKESQGTSDSSPHRYSHQPAAKTSERPNKSGAFPTSTSHESLSSSSMSSSSSLPLSLSADFEGECQSELYGEAVRKRGLCLSGCLMSEFIGRFYGPFLEKLPVKVVVILLFIAAIIGGVVGISRVKEGLDMVDVIPYSSPQRDFYRIQSKYFGFYNFYVATQDNFDYSSESGQRLLISLHHSFSSISNIIRSEDGSFPEFWLEIFRNWLLNVQSAFDIDRKRKYIRENAWLPNTTSLGRLGFKLMAQTARLDPNNEKGIFEVRLVENGIIYPPGFYIYLTAWASTDTLSYSLSQASIQPNPNEWHHDDVDTNLSIPPSKPITFAQSAFHLNNLYDTETTMKVLSEIRNICDTFTSQGLPNYPHGLVITYWEQYFTIRFYLIILIITLLALVYLIVLILLLNPFAAFLEVFVLACTMVELYGFMGWTQIKMSALPAAIVIVSIGATVQFSVPLALAFQTSIGSRDRRMTLSLEHIATPVTHTLVAASLSLLLLVASEFTCVIKYIFVAFVAMLVLGYFNGVVFFPVLLSIVGHAAEVIPLNDELYLSPPSPILQPPRVTLPTRTRSSRKVKFKKKSRSSSKKKAEPPIKQFNLPTIIEESSNNSCGSSVSIDFKSTIIINNTPRGCPSDDDDDDQSCSSSSHSSSPSLSSENRDRKSSKSDGSQCPVDCRHNSAEGTSPLRISSSGHHITTVETTAKVTVHIHEQPDKRPRRKSTSRHGGNSRRCRSNVTHFSENPSVYVHSRPQR